jgi:hypothetical protein
MRYAPDTSSVGGLDDISVRSHSKKKRLQPRAQYDKFMHNVPTTSGSVHRPMLDETMYRSVDVNHTFGPRTTKNQ